MAVHRRPRQAMLATEILFAARRIAVTVAGTVFHAAADAFDMVVMAFLRLPDIGFEAQHLFAVFAHLAVHHRGTLKDLLDPILESIKHQAGGR